MKLLAVIFAMACSFASAQVIDYPLPETHSSVNYNRGEGLGTFKVPWQDQGTIHVFINNVEYNFNFDLSVVNNEIVSTQSKVQFCQTLNVGVCSTGSPAGTFTPAPLGQYWGVFESVTFDAEGTAGSFKSPGSRFDFGIVNRISYSVLKNDSVLALQ